MTTATVTEQDIAVLMDLMEEFTAGGRHAEATAVAHAYMLACSIVYPEAFGDEHDEEFAREFEEAVRDLDAGRWLPHEDVMRRLRLRNNG